MKTFKTVPINIWDDYYEEGFIPEGEIQETFIYVEDSEIPKYTHKKCLGILLEYMQNSIKLDGVELSLWLYDPAKKYPNLVGMDGIGDLLSTQWRIDVKHLTHKRRELLVEELNSSKLNYNGIPFDIYSES